MFTHNFCNSFYDDDAGSDGKSRVMGTRAAWRGIRFGSPLIAREPGRVTEAEQGLAARRESSKEEFVMAIVTRDINEWAKEQFEHCELGDPRRTARLIKVAGQAAEKPDAATTTQAELWGDLKATYRLFNRDEATFEAITAPHQELTRRQTSQGVWLILGDTTELNYGYLRDVEGIGRVGSEKDRGFFLHTALAVNAASGELAGVSAQELYTRPLKKVKRVSSYQRKQRATRETDVWGRVIDRVGPPPEGVRSLHVCDRGADNFDVYCHLVTQQAGWVIRAAQLTRQVRDVSGTQTSLQKLISSAPCLGTYELKVNANNEQPARTALLEVRAAPLSMPRPKSGVSRYVRETGLQEIAMWVVEAREVSPVPADVEPLRWVLLTSEETTSFEQAWTIIAYYEQRPLIEEYHKCLKTGCSIEKRQYRTAGRLEAVIGLIAVLGVRLLQMKQSSRADPDRPANEVVPPRWTDGLSRVLKRPRPLNTVREFFRALASLGGFLGRKSDGEPGWQTIWRGLDTLLKCLRGMDARPSTCG